MAWAPPDAIPVELAADAIRQALAAEPDSLRQIRTRLPRVVFEARIAGRDAFLKAEVPNHERDYALALEAWAMQKAKEAGIPVAEVLHVDCSESRLPFRFMVMSKVEGRPLEDVSLSWDAEERLLREAGRLISSLHALEIDGFGRLDDEGFLRGGTVRGPQSDWPAATTGFAVEALDELWRAGVIPDDSRARSELAAGAEMVPHLAHGRLLHGDLGRSHILVDERGNLTGIIDFGDRESADSEWELGAVLLWEGLARFAAVAAGLAGEGIGIDGDLVRHYSLVRLLGIMHRRLKAGRVDDLRALRARFDALLST